MDMPDQVPSAFPHPPGIRRVPFGFGAPHHHFVLEATPSSVGMDLRDWFASFALVGLVVHLHHASTVGSVAQVCGTAYAIADGMLVAQARRPAEAMSTTPVTPPG